MCCNTRCVASLRMEMKRVSIMICAAKIKKEASSRMPPGYPAANYNNGYELIWHLCLPFETNASGASALSRFCFSRSINQPTNQASRRASKHPVSSASVSQSVSQSVNQSINQMIKRSIDQSIDQSMNQSAFLVFGAQQGSQQTIAGNTAYTEH